VGLLSDQTNCTECVDGGHCVNANMKHNGPWAQQLSMNAATGRQATALAPPPVQKRGRGELKRDQRRVNELIRKWDKEGWNSLPSLTLLTFIILCVIVIQTGPWKLQWSCLDIHILWDSFHHKYVRLKSTGKCHTDLTFAIVYLIFGHEVAWWLRH
jgi:hypothetical protein